MFACRRTSTPAIRACVRQCRREVPLSVRSQSVKSVVTSNNRRCLSSLPDHSVIGMPALSPTMTHGNLGSWGKQEGDEIAAGDVVCEVETDKATVDFDAQDDSFMAKHLVEAGTQDIPVGTPIFVTVEDADAVAAFKDFKAEAVVEESAEPAPEPVAPEPAVEEKVAVAAPPAPSPAPAPVAPAPAPAAPVEVAPAAAPVPASDPGTTSGHIFKRDWGSGVRGSPLAHRLSAAQKKYIERFGSTLQQPLDS